MILYCLQSLIKILIVGDVLNRIFFITITSHASTTLYGCFLSSLVLVTSPSFTTSALLRVVVAGLLPGVPRFVPNGIDVAQHPYRRQSTLNTTRFLTSGSVPVHTSSRADFFCANTSCKWYILCRRSSLPKSIENADVPYGAIPVFARSIRRAREISPASKL